MNDISHKIRGGKKAKFKSHSSVIGSEFQLRSCLLRLDFSFLFAKNYDQLINVSL